MESSPETHLDPARLRIPTLPEVVQRVHALVDDPGCSTREIAEVVAEDAPLAARVLQIANSAFYGLRERCISTTQACTVLGLRVLKIVVTQAGVLQQYEHLRKHPGFDLDEVWRHSILTAQVCSFAARHSRAELPLRPEELYVCGLLHDIGKVVLLDELADDYLDVVAAAKLVTVPLFVVERQMLGLDHTVVGAMVAERWKLPPQIADAIRHHHGPRERVREDPGVALVANVNLVTSRVMAGDHEAARATLDAETSRFLGLSARNAREVVDYAVRALPLIEL